METGTAIILVALLFFILTHRGFRRFAIGVGILAAFVVFVHIEYMAYKSTEQQAVLHPVSATIAVSEPKSVQTVGVEYKYPWITPPEGSPLPACHATIDANGKPFIYNVPCIQNDTVLK